MPQPITEYYRLAFGSASDWQQAAAKLTTSSSWPLRYHCDPDRAVFLKLNAPAPKDHVLYASPAGVELARALGVKFSGSPEGPISARNLPKDVGLLHGETSDLHDLSRPA